MIGPENFGVSLRPATLARLEPVIWQLAEAEWEDDMVRVELSELANDIRSRLQKIAVGDIQQVSG